MWEKSKANGHWVIAHFGYVCFSFLFLFLSCLFVYITWLIMPLHLGIGTIQICFLDSAVVQLDINKTGYFFPQKNWIWLFRQRWTGTSRSKDSVPNSTGSQSPTCSLWSGTVQSQNGSTGSFPGSELFFCFFFQSRHLLPTASVG